MARTLRSSSMAKANLSYSSKLLKGGYIGDYMGSGD